MFPRRSRLSKEEIAKVAKSGLSIHTPYFSLKILLFPENMLENKAKFAFVMSKKEEKTAVGRNNAKRRLRAAVQPIAPTLKPLYCMVFIKKSALKAAFPDLKEVLTEAFVKKGFIRG
jgi:ribonuclease P protein component